MQTIDHSLEPITGLSPSDVAQMLSLMEECYLGVNASQFEHDLREKQVTMVLRERGTRTIVGFSTFLCGELNVDGTTVTVIFSGDTVVRTAYRSSLGFAYEATAYLTAAADASPHPTYYLLTSKGWRTYRVLPLLFREYYPSRLRRTPDSMLRIMDAFGQRKYPAEYHPEGGLVIHSGESQRLRPHSGEAECLCRADPEAEFFFQRNPAFLRGDELVCLARVSRDNFSRATAWLLRQRETHA